jgi:hypothetical protein
VLVPLERVERRVTLPWKPRDLSDHQQDDPEPSSIQKHYVLLKSIASIRG